MKIFVNFDLDLYFQGHLLQRKDGQTQCDYFGENLIKSGWIVSEKFNFCFCFSTSKIETKLCGNLWSCSTFFIELEYLDQNPQTILELVEEFSRKLIIYFHSTWKRKQNFGEKTCNIPHILDWESVGILRLSIAACKIRWPNHSNKRNSMVGAILVE